LTAAIPAHGFATIMSARLGTRRRHSDGPLGGGFPVAASGGKIMCDYSLEHVAARPAAVADRLIVTTFPHTVTRGFAAAGDFNTAVCLRPGTEIAFDQAPVFEHPVTHRQVTAVQTVARFRQIDLHVRHMHHDALEFADGTVVPLTRLVPGQRATVLQLPSVPLHEAGRAQAPAQDTANLPA
jgi:hypothetical protein